MSRDEWMARAGLVLACIGAVLVLSLGGGR